MCACKVIELYYNTFSISWFPLLCHKLELYVYIMGNIHSKNKHENCKKHINCLLEMPNFDEFTTFGCQKFSN